MSDFPYFGELKDKIFNAAGHAIWATDRTEDEYEKMQDMRDQGKFVELWSMFKPSERYIFSLRMDNPKCGECGCMECMVWDVSKKDLVDPLC